MFQLKSPSLLHFDTRTRQSPDHTLLANLKRLYHLGAVPSDTQMRSILDPIEPGQLRTAFRAVHSAVQRGGMLEDFKVLEGKLLLSIDGTGQFSSTRVSCPPPYVNLVAPQTRNHSGALLEQRNATLFA